MRLKFALILLIALSMSLLPVAYAETISGKVIAVADGDTLTILDASKTQIKIRLAAIDAPEKIKLLVIVLSNIYLICALVKMRV